MTAFSWRNTLVYWRALLELASGLGVLRDTLDIPLEQAILRSRWMVGWTTSLCLVTGAVLRPDVFTWLAHRLAISGPLSDIILAVIFIASLAISIVLAYGFFRLYTLVGHVMTVNVFKTRGQRLRLLNIQSTVLPLAAPICVGSLVAAVRPVLGWSIVGCSVAYGIVLFSYGYNLIFHKQRFGGFTLLIGTTLVTWFVLFIGALAIFVTAAVLVFFGLVILRLFARHVSP